MTKLKMLSATCSTVYFFYRLQKDQTTISLTHSSTFLILRQLLYSKYLRGVTFSTTKQSSVPTLFAATQLYVPEYSSEAFFRDNSPASLSTNIEETLVKIFH